MPTTTERMDMTASTQRILIGVIFGLAALIVYAEVIVA